MKAKTSMGTNTADGAVSALLWAPPFVLLPVRDDTKEDRFDLSLLITEMIIVSLVPLFFFNESTVILSHRTERSLSQLVSCLLESSALHGRCSRLMPKTSLTVELLCLLSVSYIHLQRANEY